MLVGACGIACEPGCGLLSRGICPGCDREMAAHLPCPVLKCAVKNDVRYCAKDCDDFPCLVFEQGFPYSETYIGMYKNRAQLREKV